MSLVIANAPEAITREQRNAALEVLGLSADDRRLIGVEVTPYAVIVTVAAVDDGGRVAIASADSIGKHRLVYPTPPPPPRRVPSVEG